MKKSGRNFWRIPDPGARIALPLQKSVAEIAVHDMRKRLACFAAAYVLDHDFRRGRGPCIGGDMRGHGDLRMRPKRVGFGKGLDAENIQGGMAQLTGIKSGQPSRLPT